MAPNDLQRPLGPIEAIEGYYLARVLDFIYTQGILADLAGGQTVESIAARRGLDRIRLEALLDFVAARSDVLARSGETFMRPSSSDMSAWTHHLDQYVGGYGRFVDNLADALRDGETSERLFDPIRHAAAFADQSVDVELRQVVEELRIESLLDLGCGCGTLLFSLAERRPSFRGLGIDANVRAVDAAQRALQSRGLGSRIKFETGDAVRVMRALPRSKLDGFDAIVASSLVNAFFGARDGDDIYRFLDGLASVMPSRILIIADYYGALGAGRFEGEDRRRTLFHDLVQTLSGQGVPPADLAAWQEIYTRSRCRLIHALEGTGDGVHRFIHIVQLSTVPPPRAADHL